MPFEQERSEPIPVTNPTPEMLNHAIGSPGRPEYGPNVQNGPKVSPEQAEIVGGPAVEATAEVAPVTDIPTESQSVNPYAKRLDAQVNPYAKRLNGQ